MDFSNPSIAAHFDEIADWLEIQGENAFRIRAYRNAAENIRDLSTSLRGMVERGDDISELKGIGSAIADKTKELIVSGKISALEELRAKFPVTLLGLMRIPGLGPKKVGVLFAELGVTDLDSLKLACEQKKIRLLRGFGEKTEIAILHGISIAAAAAERMRIDDASQLIEQLSDHLRKCPEIEKFAFAGSFRRGRETIGDIDILAVSTRPEAAMQHFIAYPDVREVIGSGETKTSIRFNNSFQADLRIVESQSWGAALQYFTGSQHHNIHMRQLAKDRGYKLNEYGLIASDEQSPPIDTSTEEVIYSSLGLPWIAPEFRENRFEFESSFADRARNIIQLTDIVCDLHMHTTATDGTESIESMAMACKAKGYTHFAITDHSKRVSMARGLTSERLLEQWATIDRLNESGTLGIRILKGIECDILEDGLMDLPNEVLQQADWVLASVHYGQRQTREMITERILNALKNPFVHAIAHPTGRLLGQREPYEVDIDMVIKVAKDYGKALEINANPHRLDLSDVHAMQAAAAGVPITINTDAHSIANLELMHFGIMQARRAGILKEQVINAWPIERFEKFSKQHR